MDISALRGKLPQIAASLAGAIGGDRPMAIEAGEISIAVVMRGPGERGGLRVTLSLATVEREEED